MAQFVCPLCGQQVSKTLYDKITGIWVEKQKLESKFKDMIASLKTEKGQLRAEYLRKEKSLRESFRSKSLIEIRKKTQLLSVRIERLKKEKDLVGKKAEQKIHKAIHQLRLQEERKTTRKISQLKREFGKSAKKEVQEQKLRLELSLKQKEVNLSEKTQKKIEKYQQQNALTLKRADSLEKKAEEFRKKNEDLRNQLKKQTTPQVEGLLYEDTLLKALQDEFPEDKFQHTGTGGDLIQSVIQKGNCVGIVVYECKKVLKFTTSHINQAAKAKIQRNADFAILVTNATKKGYNGFSIEKGVIIVHPAGVLSLARMLRGNLIQIATLKVTQEERNKVLQEMIEYMKSTPFKNSIENILAVVMAEWKDLKEEVNDHWKRWNRRKDAYFDIYHEAISVKQNTLDALTGEKSRPELPQKKVVLSLPEFKEK